MPVGQLASRIGEMKKPHKYSIFIVISGMIGNGEIPKAMTYALA